MRLPWEVSDPIRRSAGSWHGAYSFPTMKAEWDSKGRGMIDGGGYLYAINDKRISWAQRFPKMHPSLPSGLEPLPGKNESPEGGGAGSIDRNRCIRLQSGGPFRDRDGRRPVLGRSGVHGQQPISCTVTAHDDTCLARGRLPLEQRFGRFHGTEPERPANIARLQVATAPALGFPGPKRLVDPAQV